MESRHRLFLLAWLLLNVLAQEQGPAERQKKESEGKAPQKKPISFKKARKVLKEMIALLSTASAKDDIAVTKADFHGKKDLVNMVGTVVERLVAPAMKKYGFEEGLLQALASVHAAGQDHGGTDIKEDLQTISRILGIEDGREAVAADGKKQKTESKKAKSGSKPVQTGGASSGKQQDPQLPPTKHIGVKKARKLMKEMISLLTKSSATKALDEAKISAKGDGPEAIVEAAGAVVERLVASLCDRYGFEEGLLQALASVNAADEKSGGALKEHLHAIGKIMSGGPNFDLDSNQEL